MNTQRELPDWEKLYQEDKVESMPWFNPNLDADFDKTTFALYIV